MRKSLFSKNNSLNKSNKTLLDTKNFVLYRFKLNKLEQEKVDLQIKIDKLTNDKEQEITNL
ncbi:hypothetical protein, partial [Candidatus Phytoplasma prunorum]|uniref:hypothetical protein n=1 Tax=Candidatus Phytoplasma prunorum TaxID=47565 RepID=UPI002FF27E4B